MYVPRLFNVDFLSQLFSTRRIVVFEVCVRQIGLCALDSMALYSAGFLRSVNQHAFHLVILCFG